jgi:hypothetical protein
MWKYGKQRLGLWVKQVLAPISIAENLVQVAIILDF